MLKSYFIFVILQKLVQSRIRWTTLEKLFITQMEGKIFSENNKQRCAVFIVELVGRNGVKALDQRSNASSLLFLSISKSAEYKSDGKQVSVTGKYGVGLWDGIRDAWCGIRLRWNSGYYEFKRCEWRQKITYANYSEQDVVSFLRRDARW